MERNLYTLGGENLNGDAEPVLTAVYDSRRHCNLTGQVGFGGRTIFLSIVAAFRLVSDTAGSDTLSLDEHAVQGRGGNIPLFMVTNFNFRDAVKLRKPIQFWGDRTKLQEQSDGSSTIQISSYNPDVTHPATTGLINVGSNHQLALSSLDRADPYPIEDIIGFMDRLPGLYAYRELLSDQDYQIALAAHEGRQFDGENMCNAFVTTQVKKLVLQREPADLDSVRMSISLRVSDDDKKSVVGHVECKDKFGDFASGEFVYKKLDWQQKRSVDVDPPDPHWRFSISDVSL
ncbi:MAG: hypothetical protein AB8B83_08080 [Bdellovibrionales bacterium]